MFLSRDDLVALTGYKQRAKVCSWLDAHRWRYVVSASGWPVVAVEEARRHLRGGRDQRGRGPALELVR